MKRNNINKYIPTINQLTTILLLLLNTAAIALELDIPERNKAALSDSVGHQLQEAKDSLKSIEQLSNKYSNNPTDTINKMEQRVEGLKTEIEDSIPSIKVLEETEIIKVGGIR